MNTEKDYIKDIFHEMKQENPSCDFMKNLMARVEKESVKQQRKKEIFGYLWIAASIICITGIPAIILYFFKINISFNLNLQDIFGGIIIEPSYIIFSLIILFLLIGDSFLRKHYGFFSDKNKKTDVLSI